MMRKHKGEKEVENIKKAAGKEKNNNNKHEEEDDDELGEMRNNSLWSWQMGK